MLTKEEREREESEYRQWVKETESIQEREFLTEEGIPIKRVYTPLDLEEMGFDYLRDLGFPGKYPLTRGIEPSMYRAKPWTIGTASGLAGIEESNHIYKEAISRGMTLIGVLHDMVAQNGLDPDHPMAEGEIGRVAVPIYSLKDFEELFDGIDISKIYLRNNIMSVGIVTIAMHLALAEKQGVSIKTLRGATQSDFLKEYISRGNWILPPRAEMRLLCDSFTYCLEHAPLYNPLSVSSYHIAEAGANRIQEGAYLLAIAIAYVEAVLKRGINVDQVAPLFNFFMRLEHRGFLEEIAKIRAVRAAWSRIMKERFNSKSPGSNFYLWIREGGSTLTKDQYLINLVRMGITSLAGMLSGCQQMTVPAYDEAISIPTDKSLRSAQRCMQIVEHETGVGNTVDPLGGSYYLEYLTHEYKIKMRKEVEVIDGLGGMVAAIEKRYPQQQIALNAYKQQKKIDSGETIIVGLNRFCSDEKESVETYEYDPEVARKRIEEIQELRKNRDNERVKKALDKIRRVAEKPEGNENNLAIPIMEAVKSYATRGEMCNVLREVFGEYKERSPF